VADVTTDELSQADQAFAGNRLLATFSIEARGLIEPYGELVELAPGDVVLSRGKQVEVSTFPVGPTMVSLGIQLTGGRSVEVASIGREGAVGGIVSCGHAPAFSRAVVLVRGPAFKVPMTAIEDAKRRSTFIANIFCRFSDYLLAQVMQSAACNAYHSIPERAARWLLHTQDRAGDRIELTQEAFADLLGVQRTTINAVVRALQEERLIDRARDHPRDRPRRSQAAGVRMLSCAGRSFRRGDRTERQRRQRELLS
jgi:cAMP-binding proteins - catabolite gene activator and regulatory subunit of cAMP-dependent protein kinases